jgi:hypothetical protein
MAQTKIAITGELPLTLRIVRGRGRGEMRVLAEGFNPIELMPHDRIIIRPERKRVCDRTRDYGRRP